MPCSWVERFNIVKISTFSKMMFRFNTILIKILAGDKLLLRNCKRLKIAKTTMKSKNKIRRLIIPDLKTY